MRRGAMDGQRLQEISGKSTMGEIGPVGPSYKRCNFKNNKNVIVLFGGCRTKLQLL